MAQTPPRIGAREAPLGVRYRPRSSATLVVPVSLPPMLSVAGAAGSPTAAELLGGTSRASLLTLMGRRTTPDTLGPVTPGVPVPGMTIVDDTGSGPHLCARLIQAARFYAHGLDRPDAVRDQAARLPCAAGQHGARPRPDLGSTHAQAAPAPGLHDCISADCPAHPLVQICRKKIIDRGMVARAGLRLPLYPREAQGFDHRGDHPGRREISTVTAEVYEVPS